MDDNVIEIPKFKPPNLSPRLIAAIIGAILVVVIVSSGVYQVEAEEEAVVLRFGSFVRTSGPGLHFKIPLIETVRTVPVQRQLKQEFGFRTVQANVRSRFSERKFGDESLMLTGDLNVAVVEWIVQYRVVDSFKYLFRVVNIEDTFRDMNEAVMRQIVGNRTVTEVLTVGRQAIESVVKEQLQELCDHYETGISVDQVVLQDVNPPDPVKPSWDEVNQAQQQKDRLINEAQTEYNTVIPRAEGEAKQLVLQAEGYATNRVNRSQGDAARFKAISDEFRKAPEVTRQRMYLETVEKILPQVGGKLFLDTEAEGVLPLLPLETINRITNAPRSNAVQGGGGGSK